jgi:protein gp37
MNRWRGTGVDYTVPGLEQVEVYLEEALLEPLRWRKPRQVFVCSMTDLFGEFVKDEWIDKVYAVMALAEQHTFLCLTKRPARRLKYLAGSAPCTQFADLMHSQHIGAATWPGWPLPNVLEGTSVCTQEEADKLIPIMLQTPAALRWLSIEPILEAIEIPLCHMLDWVVVGGESGQRARPTHVSWIRSIIEQCKAACCPVFCKQLGKHPMINTEPGVPLLAPLELCDPKGGDFFEWPADLRVRQMP